MLRCKSEKARIENDEEPVFGAVGAPRPPPNRDSGGADGQRRQIVDPAFARCQKEIPHEIEAAERLP